MPLPQVIYSFTALSTTAIERAARGIVCLLLKDAVGLVGVTEMSSAAEIPAGLTAANKAYINQAFIGNERAPLKVIAVVRNSADADWANALASASSRYFNYLAAPDASAAENTAITTWVDGMRNQGKYMKYICAGSNANKEFVINLSSLMIAIVDKNNVTHTPQKFTSRVAGYLAGTPLNSSITYGPLPDIASVTSLTKTQLDSEIDLGNVVLFHDGQKVKFGRGMTTLTTFTATKPKSFSKIKIMEIIDLIQTDLQQTLQDNYIGKVSNSHNNRLLLVTAIQGYLQSLIDTGLLERGASASLDLDAMKTFLTGKGVQTANLSDAQIAQQNFDDKVFVKLKLAILDATEDITIALNLV
jgi:hypothetical protein